jgi:hypothetical protein
MSESPRTGSYWRNRELRKEAKRADTNRKASSPTQRDREVIMRRIIAVNASFFTKLSLSGSVSGLSTGFKAFLAVTSIRMKKCVHHSPPT